MELKQYCPYCSGKIAYPSEMAGSSTVCPHCQREVELDREIKQECRACGEKVGFPESLLGESVACPHCGKSMKLHRPASEALRRPGSTQETGAAKSQYYLPMRGKTEGPFTEAEVCGYIEKDWIRADTRVQVDSGGAWFVLGQFQQFSASLMKQNAPKAVEEEAYTDEGPPEITVLLGDQHHGPYTVGQIRHALKIGSFDGYAKAHRPGMPGWLPLKKWDEFKNLEVVKALGLGSTDWQNQGFAYAMECLLTGVILIVTFMAIFIFRMGLWTEVGAVWIAALGWLMGRHVVYPEIGNEEDSGSISAQGTRDWKIMGGMLFWLVIMIFRARAQIRKPLDEADLFGGAVLGGVTYFLLLIAPIMYLMVRGLNAGIRFFFKQEKTNSGWIINIFGLLIHLAFITLFILAIVGVMVLASVAS